MNKHSSEDTIAAVSTPIGEGGICIVRLSGPDALKIADKIFVPKDGKKPSGFKSHTIHYGVIIDMNRPIDEVLLTVMRAPRTYTKEDIIEINCHGGVQAAKRALELVVKCGSRLAEPGEFTKRAFLNGRLDLAQAEAVLDVIRAKTEGALKVALDQLDGSLSKSVNKIRESMLDVASQIEASIDFPDEDMDKRGIAGLAAKADRIIADIKKLADSYSAGAILREGVLAIICGKPNVGKSSLMNLLLKRDRVIVSPVPGTTRDAIEETINLKGIPVRLVDTAGITKTKDALERQGVKKSRKYMKLADIALFVLDASTKIDKADINIMRSIGNKKKLVMLNKIDKPRKINEKELKKYFKGDDIIEISVKSRENIELVEDAIVSAVWSGKFHQGEPAVVSNARHKELLDRALGNMLSVNKGLEDRSHPELVAIDIKEAIDALGLMVGKTVSDDILDRIFTQFCIGK